MLGYLRIRNNKYVGHGMCARGAQYREAINIIITHHFCHSISF